MTSAIQTQPGDEHIKTSNSTTDMLFTGDTDILDEFLDQRVYDSLTSNTPTAPSPPAGGTTGATAISHHHHNNNGVSSSLLNTKLEDVDASMFAATDDMLLQQFHALDPLPTQLHKLLKLQLLLLILLQLNHHIASYELDDDSNAYVYSFDNPSATEQDPSMQQHQHQQQSDLKQELSSPAPIPDVNFTMEDLNMPTMDDDNEDDNSPSVVPVPKPFFPTNSVLSDYDVVREEFSKVKFGNQNMNPCPDTLQVLDKSYLDFSPEAMSKLPYTLELSLLPSFSRVETQIKLKFHLLPPPPQILLHVPQDLIYKNKFCLADSLEGLSEKLKKSMLYLDAYVLTSDLKVSCGICSRCIKREQKRASRRKMNNGQGEVEEFEIKQEPVPASASASASTSAGGVMKNNPNSWANDKMMKKAVIFNCKELVSFPPPNGLNTDLSKSLELSVRIICYCRHHKESEGFKLLFIIKNYEGEVVAKQLSSSIMIMDRKKNLSMPTSTPSINNSLPGSTLGSTSNLQALNHSNSFSDVSSSRFNQTNNDLIITKTNGDESLLFLSGQMMQPISPNSIDESASDPHTTTNTDHSSVPGLFSSLNHSINAAKTNIANAWNSNLGSSTNPGMLNGTTSSTASASRKRKKLSVDDSLNESTNPMYNGSTNGFSPVSNSDTNTSVTNSSFMAKPNGASSHVHAVGATMPSQPQPQIHLQPSSLINGSPFAQSYGSNPLVPSIQKIIPAQGPIRGGIEVTLLGFNFKPGLQVKFGPNLALATHCWSETTIVTYLPPANQPGQVLVTFDNPLEDNSTINNLVNSPRSGSMGTSVGSSFAQSSGIQHQQIFTYNDDTDRQLIELALQIVGLKMNGKLEDAKNIARRIVNSDNTGGGNNGGNEGSSTTNTRTNSSYKTATDSDREWFVNASRAVETLTKSDMATEEILIDFLSLVDLPNCPIIIPNWQLCNDEGQTLLHLATLKNYGLLVRFLISHGCKVDVRDTQGITPLFLASMCGYRSLMTIFLECKSKWNTKLSNQKYMKDYCDMNVLDMFNSVGSADATLDDKSGSLSKSVSMESLNSLFTMGIGRHISRMVKEEETTTSSQSVNKNKGGSITNATTKNKLNRFRSQLLENVVEGSDQQDEDDEEELGFADDEDACNNEFDYLEFTEEESDIVYLEDDYSDYDDEYEEENIIASQPVVAPVEAPSTTSEAVEEDNMSASSTSTIVPGTLIAGGGIWSKVSRFLSKEEEGTSASTTTTTNMEESLPSYDDLFPFGPHTMQSKPKTFVERELNAQTATSAAPAAVASTTNVGSSADVVTTNSDEEVISSDSSEDMVMSYINRPRKTVENDKMLLFFWFPTLVLVVGIFLLMSVFDYKFKTIESIKQQIRMLLGNLLVGNERIARIFDNDGVTA
ncbi:SPT3 Dosage dependent suppressor of Ty-induced promoter mutations-like protein [Scheffersomyces spartinae]|uniref:SPT3 Dosage dependent suppressor of Ty-induced promoter mutations-like protein n=1 Tax=Scheffersomyces spartinae TaxID=45513 RepID=A0A9P7VAN4_9ASCO|nr:SPT3 Dosage dependent suppressor of Ty-induced promoter mutations-like protein [Scheffersomyces spartinae]KAG7194260.1 SPT3 Dosage dependent suppressor of Ty-induced promoter mutations-like protein [Scheffersomyces spartinae]